MNSKTKLLVAFSIVSICSGVGPSHGWSRPDAPLSELYDAFFTELPTAQPCIGMSNGKGETQCYAQHRTSPLFLVQTQNDWEKLKSQDGHWTAVLNFEDVELEREFFKALKGMSASRVNAIVTKYPTMENRPSYDSPLDVIPNYDISLYNTTVSPKWNPEGTGIFSMPLPLIVRVNTSDHHDAVTGAKVNAENSYSYPLNSAQFNYVMQSAGETMEQCLYGKHCTPYGGWSLWGTSMVIEEVANLTRPVKFTAVAAPLDVGNLFTQYQVPGASVIGGLVSMLAAADAIKNNRDEMVNPALFFFFAGSQYGESGASRLLKDIFNFTSYQDHGNKKLTPDSNLEMLTKGSNTIQYYLTLDQIGVEDLEGGLNESKLGMYSFSDQQGVKGGSQPTQATARLVRELGLQGVQSGQPYLPPSSAHTLLNIPGVSDSDIGVATLAGYPRTYLNRYVGSAYDIPSPDRLNETVVLETAKTLTNTIWALSEATTPAPPVNETLFSEIFHCFTVNVSCDLFLSYRYYDSLQRLHMSQYKYSNNWSPRSHSDSDLGVIYWFIREFMRDRWQDEKLSSDEGCFGISKTKMYQGGYGCSAKETCIRTADTDTSEMVPYPSKNGSTLYTNRTGTCKMSSTYFYSAVGPGIDGYYAGYRFQVNPSFINYYPAYSLSKYNTLSNGFRLYVQDSVAREVTILIVGIIVFGLSLAAVVNFRSRVIPKLKND
eukprot:TRINITY_DN5646_c1_g1_i1.p1 TRINITY_DN5646_c1_g1~~TRINITY_DN5646_c1_g1_i1.p1  ORF type:complete len:714 (+),score=90.29 TRINITY_DN5646_c1_g1_i1:76-2217(+)